MSSDITPSAILNIITGYLTTAVEKNIITLSVSGDPQTDSLANQKTIADSLKAFTLAHPLFSTNGILFEVPLASKFWCDFIIRTQDNRLWLPINLKVSSFKGRDDLSSKEGVFYALTGIDPQTRSVRSWDSYCKELASHIRRDNCDADYYYLVVRKSRPDDSKADVFWTTLLPFHSLYPNGNRPPFQCCWKENLEPAQRPRNEAIAYILSVLEATLVQRALALRSFSKYVAPLLRGWDRKTAETNPA